MLRLFIKTDTTPVSAARDFCPPGSHLPSKEAIRSPEDPRHPDPGEAAASESFQYSVPGWTAAFGPGVAGFGAAFFSLIPEHRAGVPMVPACVAAGVWVAAVPERGCAGMCRLAVGYSGYTCVSPACTGIDCGTTQEGRCHFCHFCGLHGTLQLFQPILT